MLEEIVILDNYSRCSGKTTALAKAADELGAVFVVAHEAQAIGVKHLYPNLDVRVFNPTYLRGLTKPIIFDHYAVARAAGETLKDKESMKNALYYTINDYRFLAELIKKNAFVGFDWIDETIEDHECMAKRWNIELKPISEEDERI